MIQNTVQFFEKPGYFNFTILFMTDGDGRMSRYAALIPCYNVGKACIPVLKNASPQVEVCLAVDDGSTDDTADCIRSVNASNLKLLQHKRNLGKGAALITGFRFFLDECPELDAVITLDGDGQHDPALISNFKTAFDTDHADLVYGNRMAETSMMPAHRRWLNSLSNRTISYLCGRPIADSQCGFRLYSRKLLTDLIGELKSGRYELETEILIKSCRKNYPFATVTVPTIYLPETNALSHHSLTDVLRITRLLIEFYRNP
jgi:glycosyltransferase involved in cell wall biosynthesis